MRKKAYKLNVKIMHPFIQILFFYFVQPKNLYGLLLHVVYAAPHIKGQQTRASTFNISNARIYYNARISPNFTVRKIKKNCILTAKTCLPKKRNEYNKCSLLHQYKNLNYIWDSISHFAFLCMHSSCI